VVDRCHGTLDWRGLRLALGLTHEQMAELLCVHWTTIYRLESGKCMRPPRASATLLRAWLRDPELRQRLAAAAFPHPFPEDFADGDGDRSLS
ncbi:MAG: helix-turn-helix domain-containing protein, partial [Chloroflexi bacterium]|nr:helix-turn-helix domain-containing protein [Chloroflexota bacterium]